MIPTICPRSTSKVTSFNAQKECGFSFLRKMDFNPSIIVSRRVSLRKFPPATWYSFDSFSTLIAVLLIKCSISSGYSVYEISPLNNVGEILFHPLEIKKPGDQHYRHNRRANYNNQEI